jgi:hypothetical protein
MFMFTQHVIMTRSLSKRRNDDVIWSNVEDAAMDRYMDWKSYLIRMKMKHVRRASMRAWTAARQETFKRGGSNYECLCSDSECDGDDC